MVVHKRTTQTLRLKKMHFYWSTTYKKASLEMTSSFPKGLKSMILFLRAFFSFCKFHFSNLLQTQFFNQKKSDFGSLQERMFTQDQLHFRHDFSKVSGFLWTSYKQILIYLRTPRSYQELNYWPNKNEISLWATKKAKLIMLPLNSFDVCNH